MTCTQETYAHLRLAHNTSNYAKYLTLIIVYVLANLIFKAVNEFYELAKCSFHPLIILSSYKLPHIGNTFLWLA